MYENKQNTQYAIKMTQLVFVFKELLSVRFLSHLEAV